MKSPETLLEACGGRIRVVALTGIRSEYDLLFPLLLALDADSAFDLGVIASGVHPTPLHGHSLRHIEEDGFRVAAVIENLLYADSRSAKARSAGILLTSLAEVLSREAPDLLLVLGDREEAVVGALAGTYLGVPVVHLAGGDHTHPVGGNVDEEVRHAATKLSHVHLTMAEAHSERVRRLGEEAWRVHTVGSGGIDRLRLFPGLDRAALAEILGEAVRGDYLLVIHHPVSSAIGSAAGEMRLILEAGLATGLPLFVGAPNSDPGAAGILEVIDAYAADPRVQVYRNLPRDAFTALLRHARCLLGNSSLGLHEADYLGLPVVNVGERQRGRSAGPHVQFVDASRAAIEGALERALHDAAYRAGLQAGQSLYGDGHMAERSVEILKSLPVKERLLAKRLTY
ncbi:MAG: UDP-N-acetylglucosamine 2-epimerase (hydrolyzing) [Gammaproteobacteria bacterium]|nr:MAG: UDP-N-acetylglucosamine 2-epimerase (hydrolyzing) [Gammaproteobacteria bacterium]